MNTIEIDGSTGEGGGQILRSSLALAMCTGRPLAIHHIRAGRRKPGLMRQHLACVQAAAAVCGGKVEGAEPGSQLLRFEPGAVRAGDYSFNIGSAGSCTLVLQTVLPALMLADGPSQVSLGGGTHNPMAPPYHFIERSYAPLLRRLGVGIELNLRRHGFYPAGGGEMSAHIQPSPGGITPFDLTERGALLQAHAECLAPALPRSVAERELAVLADKLGWPREQLLTVPVPADEGPGNALMATLVHEQVTEVATVFGEKGISAERVANDLVKAVRQHQLGDAALGPHLADQWMLPLALGVATRGGTARYSCSQLTPHATTNIGVIERFLPVYFDVTPRGDGWVVSVASRSAASPVASTTARDRVT